MPDSMRILLLDDDAVDRESARRALESGGLGGAIVETGSGAEAMALMGAMPFDCILMDHVLSDRDGLMMLAELWRSGVTTPVIILTARGGERLVVDLMRAGASDYLCKEDLAGDQLVRSVRNAVRLHRAEQSAARAVDRARAQTRDAETALRVHRERMDLVVEASSLGLWYCDLPFDKLVWNARCKDHFFMPPDAEVTIGSFFEAIHPDDRESTRAAIEGSLEHHRDYDATYRTVGPNGQVKWIRAMGKGFYDETGRAMRFDGITVDVTGQKASEEALRTAKEAAESANSAKDRFLAVLSHELRTPLMPVLTTVQSLSMEDCTTPEVREALEVIRRNIELEARLIDDLLDLTRISRGRLQLNFDTVDLHEVIRNAMDICATELVAKQIGTTLDLSATKRHVRGDPARLQQVFWNLIRNAIKFTPPHGHITIHSLDEASGALKVKVIDTGIGLEAELIPRIFGAFEQANRPVSQQAGGLGLGLAISKAIVDLHGGKLRAESAGLGRGATFTVEVRPTVSLPEAVGGGSVMPLVEQTTVLVRILLVDDHQDTNRAMSRLLQRMGYAVRTAESVRAALDAAGEEKFDLLISDIGLPDGSGLELMREMLSRQPIKGIALSGFGMEEDIRRSKEAGFHDHLTKPINFKRLETAIRELSERS